MDDTVSHRLNSEQFFSIMSGKKRHFAKEIINMLWISQPESRRGEKKTVEKWCGEKRYFGVDSQLARVSYIPIDHWKWMPAKSRLHEYCVLNQHCLNYIAEEDCCLTCPHTFLSWRSKLRINLPRHLPVPFELICTSMQNMIKIFKIMNKSPGKRKRLKSVWLINREETQQTASKHYFNF